MKDISEIDPKILQDFREEWISIGLDTKRADRKKSEEAIKKIYVKSGYKEPQFFWALSPADATRIILSYELTNKVPKSSKTKRTKAKPTIEERPACFLSPDMALEAAIKCAESMSNAKFDIKDPVIRKKFNETCKNFVNSCFFGQHEWWVPQYLFPRIYLGAEYAPEANEIIDTWEILSRNCGWWGCFPEAVICVEKPIEQNRNAEGQISSDTGPALLYEDGMALWLMDGMRVDEQIVMRPETQTIEQINREENQDLRAVRIERYGWVNYLMNTNSKVIDSRKNDIEGTMEALMETPDGERRLLVTCPTNRKFALGVPPTTKSCEDAQRWLHNGKDPRRIIART